MECLDCPFETIPSWQAVSLDFFSLWKIAHCDSTNNGRPQEIYCKHPLLGMFMSKLYRRAATDLR